MTYQWYRNVVLLAGATTPYIYPSGIGDYKVQVTDTNGCQSFSTIYPLRDWKGPNSVAEVGADEIDVYPNPATYLLHVESREAIHTIISAVDGKVLITANKADIDINGLVPGVYIIAVYNAENIKIATRRVVKVQP